LPYFLTLIVHEIRLLASAKSLYTRLNVRMRWRMTHDQSDSEIPAEEWTALEAMVNLSDDALWAAAREQMSAEVQARMSVLMTKNNFGTITDEEYAELAAHVEEGDKLTLRKATAMKYLMDRGYKVTLDDLRPVDE